MNRILTIDGTRYLLPEGMTAKDIQALAGFLVTLTRVSGEYLFGEGGDYAWYADKGAEIRLESNMPLVTKSEAQEQGRMSRAAYEARKAAQAEA